MIAPRDGNICDKNDLLHAHIVGVGVVRIGSWSYLC